MLTDKDFCQLGSAVLDVESKAISQLAGRIGKQFAQACQHILGCPGRVIVIGMGKSGHIAGKIAATLASTGSPAFFVHPGEASHGDLGMITEKDVVLALSNSGETEEILTILPLIRRLGIPLITLTGNVDSTMAKMATVHLDVSVSEEACPLGLAPTSSTTAALAMGDALAVSLLSARGFTAEDFARSHPGGKLGRRLLLQVDEIMHYGEAIPRVTEDATISDALMEMSAKGFGMTTVVDACDHLVGIYTDGDLRRTLDQGMDIHTAKIRDVMTRQCSTMRPGTLAHDVVQLMEQRKITAVVIVEENNKLCGIIHLHDLFRAKVV